MDKLDLRKQLKHLYQPSAKKVEVVDVPPLLFAMIDGAIEPGSEPGMSPAFAEALQALYGISYTLKFTCKQRAENPIDYTVMGLEALWWVEDGRFDITVKDNWFWQAMILQPDFITPAMFAEAWRRCAKSAETVPAWASCAWSAGKKGWRCRSCTSARTARSRRRLPGWTNSQQPMATASAASTTRSTSATPCAPRRKS